jgi:hypothetical protein
MKLSRFVFGAVAAGLWLGAAQAAPLPVPKAPVAATQGITQGIENVQYYYGGPPRRAYGPPRYRSYGPPPGRYYGRYDGPRRPSYGARPGYGYGYGRPQRRAAPPQFYTKDQVRAWNRRNGL